MGDWWAELSDINQWFYTAAAFFSVFFLWQIIGAFMGIGGHDTDADGSCDACDDLTGDHTYDHFESGAESDAEHTMDIFRVLSIRSIITFFTLFTWATAMYIEDGASLGSAMATGLGWGLAGMICVALVFYSMRKMADPGAGGLSTCVGTNGTVYLRIPKDGTGEVRVMVGGVLTNVKARGVGGAEFAVGTPIQVTRTVAANVVEVAEA